MTSKPAANGVSRYAARPAATRPASASRLLLLALLSLGFLSANARSGVIATAAAGGPAYAPDPLSPGLGGWTPPNAFVTGAPNDDDTLGKGQNFFGATGLTINRLGPTYLNIQVLDNNAQPAGLGLNGGTPLTSAYWFPLTIANNTGQAWGGVTFKLGFGSPGTSGLFFQTPNFDNLDFNFPALPGGGLGVAPVYTPQSSAFQGPLGMGTTAMQPTYPGPIGKTILWNNGIIQPGGGNTFQWKLDVPNSASVMNEGVPVSLFSTDAGGVVNGYTFTLEIVPIIVPEPSAAALGLLGLAVCLLQRSNRKPV